MARSPGPSDAFLEAQAPTMPNGQSLALPKTPAGLGTLALRLADGVSAHVAIWARAPLGVSHREAIAKDFAGGPRRSLSEVIGLLPKDSEVPEPVAGAMAVSRDRVVHDHAADIWTLIRKAMNQEGKQQLLFRKLLAEANPRAGLRALDEALRTRFPDRLAAASLTSVTTMEELNRIIPELTAVEAGVVALLVRVPDILLDTRDGAVGMLRDVLRTGATFARDDVAFSGGDPVRDLAGLAGVEPGEEFVPFRASVTALVRNLLAQSLSDAYLFERTFRRHLESSDVVIRGQGMISAAPDFRYDSVLQNLVTEETLSVYRLVAVVGMLERVPSSLRGSDPFHGYIVPFGAGVKLVDVGGSTREYVSLHPLLQGECYEEIFHTTRTDVSVSQPMMAALAKQLRNAIEDHILDGKAPTSRVETLATDALVRLGVSLPTGGRKFFVGGQESASDRTLRDPTALAAATRHAYALKMGPDELEHTIRGLELIPEPVRQRIFPRHVVRIVKMQAPADLVRGELGVVDQIGAEYQPGSRTLVLYDCPAVDGPFGGASDDVRLLRRWAMVGELGRALFLALPAEGRDLWKQVSGGDDFPQWFATYVLCGEEFRASVVAERTGPGVGRYGLLREICGGVECEGMPGLTVDNVEAALRRLIAAVDATGAEISAEQLAEGRIQRLWDKGTVLSWEQLAERASSEQDGDPPTLPTKPAKRSTRRR